ncbi:MAG: hypothetical protein JSV66_01715 [Trueperaceae bacterium]|nr:MAG: hypothetical protein JSV66_01715 [Trueperaceae bacterium]
MHTTTQIHPPVTSRPTINTRVNRQTASTTPTPTQSTTWAKNYRVGAYQMALRLTPQDNTLRLRVAFRLAPEASIVSDAKIVLSNESGERLVSVPLGSGTDFSLPMAETETYTLEVHHKDTKGSMKVSGAVLASVPRPNPLDEIVA